MGKKDEKRMNSPKRARKTSKSSARAPMRARTGIGLPTDPWWEEAFKLGVERVSAEAALNSLEEAKKEGIVGEKIYERLRDVYLEKLSVIERKQSTWHQEFPTFSEPPARRQMMNELTDAVARPYQAGPETPRKAGATHESGSQQLTNFGRSSTTESRAPRKEFGPPAEPTNPRRAMIDELKSVLSSSKPLQSRAPMPPISRRIVSEESQPTSMREVQKGEVPALKEQILKVPNPATARISSSLMELNKEFLSEFRKLRQTGS